MNQYGSITRTLFARNMIEKSIAPPATLQLTNIDIAREQIFQDGFWTTGSSAWNPDGNLILHRIGLFCNFADGFVFASPQTRLRLKVLMRGYSIKAAMTGTISWPQNSKTITGAGGTLFTTLVAGTVIKLNPSNGPPIFGIVENVVSNTQMSMTDYGPGVTGAVLNTLNLTPEFYTEFYGVNVLNHWYDHERFFPIAVLKGNMTGILVTGQVGLSVGADPAPATQICDLLTKTIDTSYARDTAIFDLGIDLEMTMRAGTST